MIKLFRLYARLRYWRLRALRVEAELAQVKAEAKAEAYRNLYREDMFVSAAVMGSRGMVGIQPRNGPAEIPQPRPLLTEAPDPWKAVTGVEQMEFHGQWVPLGLQRGLTMQQMQQDFLRELTARKQKFSDEPSIM